MTVYAVTLNTLTPLHIGDSDELRQDFDFVAHSNGRTYRLNEDVILREKEPFLRDRQGNYVPLGKLLDDADFTNKDFFRYILPGVPRSKKTDARVKSFIKDVHDRPYIPGSSFKGALRTALAWTGWDEVIKRPLVRNDIGQAGKPKSADDRLDKKIFGDEPKYDLLRALHVSDLSGAGKANETMKIVNAQVLTKKSAGSPIELEAVKSKVAFTGTITIDDALFSDVAERELHFRNRQHWLTELVARAQKHTAARAEQLAAWFEHADQGEDIARYYRQLAGAKLGAHKFAAQIGWGAGWDAKTFGAHLQEDARLFEQIVADFRMHRAAPGSPPRKPGDPFPRSKRAVMNLKEAKPYAPLGWVMVELKPQ